MWDLCKQKRIYCNTFYGFKIWKVLLTCCKRSHGCLALMPWFVGEWSMQTWISICQRCIRPDMSLRASQFPHKSGLFPSMMRKKRENSHLEKWGLKMCKYSHQPAAWLSTKLFTPQTVLSSCLCLNTVYHELGCSFSLLLMCVPAHGGQ